MKRRILSSIVACSAVFGLLLSCGNTRADPLTLTAEVKVTMLVADGTRPTVITLRRNQVFLLRGFSARVSVGDSVEVIFAKGGDSFLIATSNLGIPVDFGLLGAGDVPLKGPATVTISGKGLVAYEIQTL